MKSSKKKQSLFLGMTVLLAVGYSFKEVGVTSTSPSSQKVERTLASQQGTFQVLVARGPVQVTEYLQTEEEGLQSQVLKLDRGATFMLLEAIDTGSGEKEFRLIPLDANSDPQREVFYRGTEESLNQIFSQQAIHSNQLHPNIRQALERGEIIRQELHEEKEDLKQDLMTYDQNLSQEPEMAAKYTSKSSKNAASWVVLKDKFVKWTPTCYKFINEQGNYGDYGKAAMNHLNSGKVNNLLKYKDLPQLCPKYKSFSEKMQKDFWVYILTSMSQEESSCNTNRDTRGTNGIASGLFQLFKGQAHKFPPNNPAYECKRGGGSINTNNAGDSIRCTLGMIRDYNNGDRLFVSSGRTYWHVLWASGSTPAARARGRIMSYAECF